MIKKCSVIHRDLIFRAVRSFLTDDVHRIAEEVVLKGMTREYLWEKMGPYSYIEVAYKSGDSDADRLIHNLWISKVADDFFRTNPSVDEVIVEAPENNPSRGKTWIASNKKK